VFEVDDAPEASGVLSLDKDKVCAIVCGGSVDVPAIHGVFAPHLMAIGFDMKLDCTPKWGKWHSVIVKRNMVVGVCGDLGGNVGLAK
jgi:hypothetical protein